MTSEADPHVPHSPEIAGKALSDARRFRWGIFRPGDLWSEQTGPTGVLRPSKQRWLMVLLWGGGMFLALFGLLLASLLGPDWLQLRGAARYAPPALVPIGGLACYSYGVAAIESRRPIEIISRRGLPALLYGVIIGTAVIGSIWLLGLVIGTVATVPSPTPWNGIVGDLVFSSWVSAVLEELAFRAVLLRLAAVLLGPLPALFLSSMIFGLAHAAAAPLFALVPLMVNGGLVFGLLYLRTGSLWAAIGAHVAYDFVEHSVMGIDSAGPLFVTSPVANASPLLSGGGFGPDGSLPGMCVGLLLATVVALGGRRRPIPRRGGRVRLR